MQALAGGGGGFQVEPPRLWCRNSLRNVLDIAHIQAVSACVYNHVQELHEQAKPNHVAQSRSNGINVLVPRQRLECILPAGAHLTVTHPPQKALPALLSQTFYALVPTSVMHILYFADLSTAVTAAFYQEGTASLMKCNL